MDYKTKKIIIVFEIIKNCFYLYCLIPWIISSKTKKHKQIMRKIKDLIFSYTTTFNIQTKGILLKYGFNKKIEELILYENIQSVRFVQSFLQQLAGEGDIQLISHNSLLNEYQICYPTEYKKLTSIINNKLMEIKKNEI
ncbi:PH domain-containing protein [Leptospira levettii]|uniref:PH domain-containing protein n=1 Tax=Leptospira levettii TaxID=2023178 RepID=UPI00223E69AE|nr:PH domain-containing protein [Leptospira levettii]MCW7498579.1 PH domain-containing protein [Leptospira levettii]